MPASKTETLRATTSFVIPGRRLIKTGALFNSDDPIVKGREHLFETASAPTERHTSTRGRNITRAAKSDDNE